MLSVTVRRAETLDGAEGGVEDWDRVLAVRLLPGVIGGVEMEVDLIYESQRQTITTSTPHAIEYQAHPRTFLKSRSTRLSPANNSPDLMGWSSRYA